MKTAGPLCFLTLALSGTTSGLIGYGISMYDPNCAFACRDIFSSAMLECSSHDHAAKAHSHGPGPTSAACYAGDTSFLTTVANCINTTCTDIESWKLEKYWAQQITKDPSVPPKWTLQETLAHLADGKPPTRQLGKQQILNYTAAFDHRMWDVSRLTMNYFEYAETMHSRTGIILLVVGFATPIFLTSLGYLPYMSGIQDKLKPRLIWPSLIGTYHIRKLPFSLGNAPTLGQSLYIAMFTTLTVVFMAVGHKSTKPNSWFGSSWLEMMAYVANRAGVHAFALAPLVVLFAGRNNILLWLTNWSHSTYMLLHRWVARLFGLQVIIHSILVLVMSQRKNTLEASQKMPYWIWGIVGTLACVVMLVASALPIRRLSYEIFLITHITLAVLLMVGSWYHINLRSLRKWGYHYWLYAVFAVWVTDRALRVLRILKNGMRSARITQVTENIVRIDIPGVRWDTQPGKHVYAFFPGLHRLRPWENHPFSIIPTAQLTPTDASLSPNSSSPISSQDLTLDIEKATLDKPHTTITATSLTPSTTSGISLYVHHQTGLTRNLKHHTSLTTLLDGPYRNTSPSAVLQADRLVLIAGGVGITAVLPFTAAHANAVLHWSIKSTGQGLVDDLRGALAGVREKVVSVGARMDVGVVLAREEEMGWGRIGVVVCGPGGLCDEVRSVVARRAREGKTAWEIDVEAFSW